MNRFFVAPEAVLGDRVVFTGQDLRHISKVLRLGTGDRVLALTGDGQEFEVELESIGSTEAVGQIAVRRPAWGEPPLTVVLVQGLAKGDKMDLIVQKCTELGVTRFLPVETERAIVRLDGAKAEQRRQRWQTIAREAAEQSRRARVPEVLPVTSLDGALRQAEQAAGAGGAAAGGAAAEVLALIPWEGESVLGLAEVLAPLAAAKPQDAVRPREVWLFIGPEGGFSDGEAARARAAGVRPVSLGPRILRTETAGLAAATMVLYALGDLGRAGKRGSSEP